MNAKQSKPKSRPKRPLPRPPQHLREQTRRWWSGVVKDYELEEHHLRILSLAAEAWDRVSRCEAIDREGLTYLDKSGAPRMRPEIAIERDSRLAFARLVRELSLDVTPPVESRPPRLAGTGS